MSTSNKDNFCLVSLILFLIQLSILGTGLGVTSMGHTAVYKSVDENGQITYSDQADGETAPIKVPKTNTAPAVKMLQNKSKSARQNTGNADSSLLTYQSLSIVNPSNDTTIHHGAGLVPVSLKISPALQKDHKIQFLVDGSIHKLDTSSNTVLENVNRGDHVLSTQIVDQRGKILKSSASISIHVIRPAYHR